MSVQLKRVYDKPAKADGTRVLVDRLWPRGLTKEAVAIKAWLRDLAPSNELRRWYHERPEQWPAFRKKYLDELNDPKAEQAVEELHRLAADSDKLTLLFASRNLERNNAVVLKELLEGMRKPPSSSGPVSAARMAAQSRMRPRR